MDYMASKAAASAGVSVLAQKEPIEKWENLGGSGINMLKRFYEDKPRKSFAFQTLVQSTMIENALELHRKRNANVILNERSVVSSRFIFTESLRSTNEISDDEYLIFDRLFRLHWKVFERQLKPTMIIYLRSTPSVCAERIRLRNRQSESCVPQEYLERLHKLHENVFARDTGSSADFDASTQQLIDICLRNVAISVINADQSMEAVQAEFQQALQTVQSRQIAAQASEQVAKEVMRG